MKVLLIDDEPLELEQLDYLIKQKWPMWEIFYAEDAEEAIELAKENKIVLALVDIMLPGKTGLELVGIFKKYNPEMSFIITTAYQDFNYAKEAIKLGVFDYLVKPIVEDELVEVIEKFLENKGHAIAKTKLIGKVLEIIEKDYHEIINLDTLAEAVHVCPTYLSKKFSEEIGISIANYIMKYRVEKAKSIIIKNLDYNLALVSEKVGFHSQNYFCNVFKKIEGVTPSKYKEIKRGIYD